MTKNPSGLHEKNKAAADKAKNDLEHKITELEKELEKAKSDPLGTLSELKSLVKVLEFTGFGLPNLETTRTTLYKYTDLKKRYEAFVDEIKAIKNDPAKVDTKFANRLKKSIEDDFKPEIEKLTDDIQKYAELLTIEQQKRSDAEAEARLAEKEVERLQKSLSIREERLRKLREDKLLRGV